MVWETEVLRRGDRARICKVFNFPRGEYYDRSTVDSLMEDMQIEDTREGVDTISEVRALLTALDDPTTGLLTSLYSATNSPSSLSVSGEYSVSYSGGGKLSQSRTLVREKKERILSLLDPNGCLAPLLKTRVVGC